MKIEPAYEIRRYGSVALWASGRNGITLGMLHEFATAAYDAGAGDDSRLAIFVTSAYDSEPASVTIQINTPPGESS